MGCPDCLDPHDMELESASFGGVVTVCRVPVARQSPCSTTGNNTTTLAVMIARGSRALAKRPRRSSRRNGNPSKPSTSDPAPSAEGSARKPRVLAILSPTPVRNEEVAAPVDPEPRTTRQVPRSHHARIRTWVNYGLTIPQVAEVYGGVIERILREG